VELSSVDEYVKVKLFQGVRVSTLEEQAKDVQLFAGSIEFLRDLQLNDIPVYILSVNWTSIIMRRVLSLNGVDVSKIRFITNEFEQVDQVLTGNVSSVRDLRTGSDKLEQFNIIKRDLCSNGIQDGVYYIGDSSSDFFPILEADCGIAFGNGGALSKLKKYNIPYVEGLEGPLNIKHIQSWNELATLLHK
jgi:phosphoserine phosphatase